MIYLFAPPCANNFALFYSLYIILIRVDKRISDLEDIHIARALRLCYSDKNCRIILMNYFKMLSITANTK